MAITVSRLFIYPVKSCGILECKTFEVDEFGPLWDRHWMIIDPQGKFITQRQFPQMALIQPELTRTHLQLRIQGQLMLVPLDFQQGPTIQATIWDDTTEGIDCGDTVAEFLSDYLNTTCRLIQKGPNHKRAVKNRFADGFPFLLVSEESMLDLNSRLNEALPVQRFRPNIVVRNCPKPFDEDQWTKFRINNVEFERVKDCARCPITTVDYKSGTFAGPEPLKTLASYRRGEKNKVIFAQNLIHRTVGEVRIGDSVITI